MPGSFRIATIAGIDIHINLSWIIILLLLTISLSTGLFPRSFPGFTSSTYFLLGLVSALLLFVSVLLHELAHSFVARARGLPVKNITLFIFGGVSNIEREPRSAGADFQVAIVGPLASLLISGICYALWALLTRGADNPIAAILLYLGAANLLLGLFNLIPGYPLDGGRILRAIVWKFTGNINRATNIAAAIGQVVAISFIIWGIFLFFSGNSFGGIWIAFIGWFMLSASQAARAQSTFEDTFHNITVQDVMSHNIILIPANISLQRLIDEYILPQGLRSALITQGEQFAGLITLSDIRHIPREQWATTPVGFVMKPVSQLHVVAPGQNLRDVITLLNDRDINQLPVVENGRLLGILSRDAVLRALEVRRRLGIKQDTEHDQSQATSS
ncbi:peptidase M50 [Ktedonobacter sp. SOSP1-52]|uniref:site-2 protease family protein n=1 Tax=Ktedonobacter sp. SOSP1-52 TaxID=2778366 RepID=UPI0019162F28|nr:site-2 protease family protein [Ktedonobacter sp. SOSP1-52]GHO62217.1 peptidase M50 [Ktedonobacter sp. SOSP1-52]